MYQDRKIPNKQVCPYIQKNIMMNWQCCCPCMMQKPVPYQSEYNHRVEDDDVRVWKGPAENYGMDYHKWNGDPMYGPGWYHHHWDGHKWNGPWHDTKPYNDGWHDNPKREGEED